MSTLYASLWDGQEEEVARWNALTPEQQAAETWAFEQRSAAIRADHDARMMAVGLLLPVLDAMEQTGANLDWAALRKNVELAGKRGGEIRLGKIQEETGTFRRREGGRTRYVTETRKVWTDTDAVPCIASFHTDRTTDGRLSIGITEREIIVVFRPRYEKDADTRILRAPRSAA